MRYEARRTRQSLLAFASMAVPVLAAVLRPAKERIVRWNPYDEYIVWRWQLKRKFRINEPFEAHG